MSKTLGTEAREVLQGKIDAQRAEIGTSLKNNLSVCLLILAVTKQKLGVVMSYIFSTST